MTQRCLVVAVALAASISAAHAAGEMVLSPVPWDSQGRYEQEMQVPDEGVVEVCEKLAAAAKVAWRFDAGAPLDFNLHFHAGKKVEMPVRKDQARRGSGLFKAKSEQDYCWMWTNKSGSAVQLVMQLQRR